MPEKKEHINLRSDKVQEIMSHVPNWMIRWGITLIFILIALGIFITWFIKYPDVITGSATLSTKVPTVKLFTKNSGEINALSCTDHKKVKKGDMIALIENSLDLPSKEYLEVLCYEIETSLEDNGTDSYRFNVNFEDEELVFGTIQADYQALKTAYLDYKFFSSNSTQRVQIANLRDQIKNYTILRSVAYQQLNTSQKQLSRAQEKFKSDKILFKKNVISKMEFYEEEKKLIQAENEVGNYKKASVESSIRITDLKKELAQISIEYNKQKNGFLTKIRASIGIIRNAIDNWGRNFEIKSPIDGELSYLENVAVNQFVESGKALFAIITNNQEFIGYLTVPQQGYGKIKIGQKVRIKVDNYPFHEFGQLDGVITSISLIATDGVASTSSESANQKQYRVEFKLSKGLKSSYGKTFEYTPEMSGSAEIITKDLRLMERIFNKFMTVFE